MNITDIATVKYLARLTTAVDNHIAAKAATEAAMDAFDREGWKVAYKAQEIASDARLALENEGRRMGLNEFGVEGHDEFMTQTVRNA